jgi:hypothetical protein
MFKLSVFCIKQYEDGQTQESSTNKCRYRITPSNGTDSQRIITQATERANETFITVNSFRLENKLVEGRDTRSRGCPRPAIKLSANT